MADWLLVTHLCATWYLIGLCWLIQRVQYPLMGRVGVEHFADYEQQHVRRIGPLVAPAMLLELATGGLLLVRSLAEAGGSLVLYSAVALLAPIWLSTFLLQVPLHRRLERGFDPDAHAALVRTNWIRTLAWTARGLLLLALLAA